MRVGRLSPRHAQPASGLGAGRRAKAVILAVASCGVLTAVIGSSPASAAPPTTFYAAPATVGAGDCTTPANACRLEAAIAATSNGDTVELAGGTYTGAGASPLALSVTTSITLRAAPGAKPVLDGSGTSDAIIAAGAGVDVTIDRLTLQNAAAAITTFSIGSITVRNSTLNNNNNGILAGTTLTIENSTISNSADDGVQAVGEGAVTVIASTIADNRANGIDAQISVLGTPVVRIGASVVAGNRQTSGFHDCMISEAVDEGFNIDSDGSCGFAAAAGSVSGSLTITGSLAPLADNGGPTPTMALLPGSPAIGLVTGALGGGLPAVCGTPDQRGVLRPAAACDAGAFQTQQVTPAAPTFTDNVCAATGPAGASYTIPSMTGVDYLVNGGPTPATAGTHPAPDGSTLTITAQPQAGYVLTGATSWTHIYPATPSCPQTITFTTTPPTNAVVGGTYTVAATGGGSGQAVIFSSGSPAICTVTGTTVHFIAAGACVVNANQAGDANYNPASQIAQTITIAAVPTPPSSTPPTQPTPQPSGSGLADTGTLTVELTLLAVLLVAGGGLVLLLGRRPRCGRVHRPRNAPWSRPD